MSACILDVVRMNAAHVIHCSHIRHLMPPFASHHCKRLIARLGVEWKHSFIPPREHVLLAERPFDARMAAYREICESIVVDLGRSILGRNPAARVTHVVVVSCTGCCVPTLADTVVSRLQLKRCRTHSLAFMGCNAGMKAIDFANELCATPGNTVLILGIEFCTLHLRKIHLTDARRDIIGKAIGNTLFSDGAAAVLVGAHSANTPSSLRIVSTHSHRIEGTNEYIGWRPSPDGSFGIHLDKRLTHCIESSIAGMVDEVLASTGVSRDSVDTLVHPGSVQILDSVYGACQLPRRDEPYDVLRRFGNMSSATIMYLLHEYMAASDAAQRRPYLMLLAPGPGVTVEVALLAVPSPGSTFEDATRDASATLHGPEVHIPTLYRRLRYMLFTLYVLPARLLAYVFPLS